MCIYICICIFIYMFVCYPLIVPPCCCGDSACLLVDVECEAGRHVSRRAQKIALEL